MQAISTYLSCSQCRWVYLEPIFGAGTLSQDQARFQRVDRDFRYIMGDVARDSKVVSLCRISNLHQTLNMFLDQLSRCQKSLNDFLEVGIFYDTNTLFAISILSCIVNIVEKITQVICYWAIIR